jgi:hypothetical protein
VKEGMDGMEVKEGRNDVSDGRKEVKEGSE